MSQHHAKIKNDPRWKQARADCLDRDGHACIECGTSDQLDADHIVRLADAPELAFELENLQTLCRDCHVEKERQYGAAQLVRAEWIHESYKELRNTIDNERKKETQTQNEHEPVPFL